MRKSIGNLRVAVKTTPPALTYIAGVLLAFLVAKILYFDGIPEAFPRAYEFGRLTQNLFEATIAAYIFFVLSYQLPLVIERQRVGPVIAYLTEYAAAYVTAFLSLSYRVRTPESLGKALPRDLGSIDTVTRLFESLAPNELIGAVIDEATGNNATWLQEMVAREDRSRELIDQVWRYARFIDSDFAKLLSDVQLSEFHDLLHRVYIPRIAPLANANLGTMASTYCSYYKAALRLSEYCKKFRKTYKIK